MDGTADLFLGSVNFLSALYQLIVYGALALFSEPSDKGLYWWMPFVVFFIMTPLYFYVYKKIFRRTQVLKERFVYPRTGYIEPRRPSRRKVFKRLMMFYAGFIPVAIFINIFALQAFVDILALLPSTSVSMGLLMTIALLYEAVSFSLTRYYILAAISVLLTIVLSVVSQAMIADQIALALYFILMGVASTISGGLTLRNFIRQYPISQEELQ